MNKKWVIFDVMGVIFEVGDDVNDLLVPYIHKRNNNISAAKINDGYLRASLGKISSYDFWAEVGLGSQYPGVEYNYLDTCLTLDSEFRPVADVLQINYNLAILSNDVKEWSQYTRGKYNLDVLFKEIVISGEVKYRKPDENIFSYLLCRINAIPSECAVVDDRVRNLHIASSMGFKTIRFGREDIDINSDRDRDYAIGSTIRSFCELPKALEKAFSGC